MTDFDDHSIDGPGDVRRPSSDLEFLNTYPSLVPLARRGWLLERLPTTSTGWAFGAALLSSLIGFGPGVAILVVVGSVLALAFVGTAILVKDFEVARAALRATRAGLLALLLVGVMFTPRLPLGSDLEPMPQVAPSAPVTSDDAVRTPPGPLFVGPLR